MKNYTDRKGRTWYLKRSTTKTGKVRFTASKDKDSGENVAALPEGYEFHENVNAQVSVRKKRVTKILPDELAMVEQGLAKLKAECRAEVKGKEIVVYVSDLWQGPRDAWDGLIMALGRVAETELRKNATFSPMLRFVLQDAKSRLFNVDRMSFHGEPDWWTIDFEGKLARQVKKFLPLLDDQDAFFETV